MLVLSQAFQWNWSFALVLENSGIDIFATSDAEFWRAPCFSFATSADPSGRTRRTASDRCNTQFFTVSSTPLLTSYVPHILAACLQVHRLCFCQRGLHEICAHPMQQACLQVHRIFSKCGAITTKPPNGATSGVFSCFRTIVPPRLLATTVVEPGSATIAVHTHDLNDRYRYSSVSPCHVPLDHNLPF